jgi:hypothetical protein
MVADRDAKMWFDQELEQTRGRWAAKRHFFGGAQGGHWNSDNCLALNRPKVDVRVGPHQMSTKAYDYEKYARECWRWAAETENREQRQAFLEMAEIWRRLATEYKLDTPAAAAWPAAREIGLKTLSGTLRVPAAHCPRNQRKAERFCLFAHCSISLAEKGKRALCKKFWNTSSTPGNAGKWQPGCRTRYKSSGWRKWLRRGRCLLANAKSSCASKRTVPQFSRRRSSRIERYRRSSVDVTISVVGGKADTAPWSILTLSGLRRDS